MVEAKSDLETSVAWTTPAPGGTTRKEAEGVRFLLANGMRDTGPKGEDLLGLTVPMLWLVLRTLTRERTVDALRRVLAGAAVVALLLRGRGSDIIFAMGSSLVTPMMLAPPSGPRGTVLLVLGDPGRRERGRGEEGIGRPQD
jgi:hypothetical protein